MNRVTLTSGFSGRRAFDTSLVDSEGLPLSDHEAVTLAWLEILNLHKRIDALEKKHHESDPPSE